MCSSLDFTDVVSNALVCSFFVMKNYSDDEERGEERENGGDEEEEEGGSVRRSKREKRLLFASFNLSEMNRQLLDPHHGFPMIDDSEVSTKLETYMYIHSCL